MLLIHPRYIMLYNVDTVKVTRKNQFGGIVGAVKLYWWSTKFYPVVT